jgi:CheY-like chemotaxis protein
MDELGYILLADDSKSDVELAKRALERQKVANEIVTVCDGAEALDFLFRRGRFSAREKRDPLIVLLDINMPKVDGFEVLTRMKSDPELRSIPVVMLLSSPQGPDVDECHRLNANASMVKPVDFDQFAGMLRTIGKFWAVINEPPRSAHGKHEDSAVSS